MAKSVYERLGHSAIAGTDQTQRRYIVKANDTIVSIAADEYSIEYVSEFWRQIAEANSVDDLDNIAVGTVLVIPTPAAPST